MSLCVALALCASTSVASAAPFLTTIGPPFQTGDLPVSVAFAPDLTGGGSRLLATANVADDSVSVFEMSAGGGLTLYGSAATGQAPSSVAFHPDGRHLATANAGGNSVTMFSASLGNVTPVGAPAPTGEGPRSVAFSPDGQLLATADFNSISVFSVSAVGDLQAVGAPVVTGEGPRKIAFSPRGGLLVTANGEGPGNNEFISVFSVTSSGALTKLGSTPTPGHPNDVAFSSDGSRLATANWAPDGSPTGSVSLFSVSAAGALTAIGAPTPTDFDPVSVAFGPGGGSLALGGLSEGKVAMYSVSAAGALAPLGEPTTTAGSGLVAVAFDASGRHLATANSQDDTVSMFLVSAGGVLTPVGAPARTAAGPCGVQFSPGGGLLATANGGGPEAFGGTISMFSLTADGHQTAVGSATSVGGTPCSLAFRPDGQLLATADGDIDSVSVFSVSPAGVLTAVGSTPLGGGPGAYAHSAAFSPDGSLLAITQEHGAGGSVSTFAVAAGGALTAVDTASTGASPVGVAFRPDGQLLAVAEGRGVSLFSVSAGGALDAVGAPTPAGDFGPTTLAFSPSGGLLATTISHNRVLLFSVSPAGGLTPIEPPTVLDSFAHGVAFGPTGGLLAATSEEYLWLFKVSAGGALTPVGSPTPFSYDPLAAVAFSPDGTLLATGNWSTSTVSVHPLAPPILGVAITSGPPASTSATSASFAFEASYPATLECRLDAGSFAACATYLSHEYTGLAEGAHTFSVRATDLLDDVTTSPASRSWMVDVTPPGSAPLAQPADGASNLRAAPVFEWSTTSDNLTGVDRYELWVDGARGRTVAAASCAATCSATPADPLAHGPHTWEVRAVDGAGNVSMSAARAFSVDAEPPAGFALTGPADGAATTSRRPALSWQAAVDGGIGVGGYDVVLDDQAAAIGLPASATSFAPAGDLADGPHLWRVIARDLHGNERASATQQFTVDTTPPVAAVTAAPNPALTGRSITFSAGGSSDAGSGIARVEWDLDGDGSFETDTGLGRTAARSYADPGTYAVHLRVSDRAGLSATARVDQRVTTTGTAGQLGITINDGARYTRSPKVTITSTWPLFASQMLVSNDGGFGAAATLPLSKLTPWTLDSSGAERSSRLVYVRFRRGLTTSETYIDDIILDESRPSVSFARVSRSRAGSAPLLTLRARDRGLAGLSRVQVTSNRRKPGTRFQAFRSRLKLVNEPGYRRLSVRRPLFVRVRDRAGNLSSWRPVNRPRGAAPGR